MLVGEDVVEAGAEMAARLHHETAQRLYDAFLPLETLRDDISLIRVLHDAVTFAQIADMGPLLPLLSSTPPEHHAKIADAARTLLALERAYERAT